MKLVHLVGFIIKKSVTMHGHVNVKKSYNSFSRPALLLLISMPYFSFFPIYYVLSTVFIRFLVIAQQIFSMYLFIYSSLHVSIMSCSSSGETDCINTASGNCHSVLVALPRFEVL